MPGGRGGNSERFAEVVDLGGGAATPLDPELSRDLEVVALLRRHAGHLGPDRQTAQRMRARLMAELATSPLGLAPQASQPPATVHGLAGRHRSGAGAGLRTPRGPLGASRVTRRPATMPGGPPGRLVVASAAALFVVLTLAAVGVLFSRDALPGDSLYSVKRVAEDVELGLTFGQEAKARKHLEFAALRLGEVEAMVHRLPMSASGPARPQGLDVALITRTLQAFDDETATGTRMLLPLATAGHDADLGVVSTWAQQQWRRLAVVVRSLPPDAKPQADSSLTLLDRVTSRAVALSRRTSCEQVTSGSVDDIGPLPATGGCVVKRIPAGSGSPSQSSLPGSSLSPVPGQLGQGPVRDLSPVLPSGRPDLAGLGDPDNSPLLDPRLPVSDARGTDQSTAPRMTVPLPLPGMPPVSLPPLLPGLPGITVN